MRSVTFRVQITCKCGAQRIAEPEALVRLCGSSATLDSAPRGFGESCRRYHPAIDAGTARSQPLVAADLAMRLNIVT